MQNFAQPKQIRFCAIKQNWIDMRVWAGGGGGGEVPSPGSRVQQPSAGQSSSQQTISNVGYEEHIAASRGLATDAPAEHTPMACHPSDCSNCRKVSWCLIVNNKHS